MSTPSPWNRLAGTLIWAGLGLAVLAWVATKVVVGFRWFWVESPLAALVFLLALCWVAVAVVRRSAQRRRREPGRP